MPSSNFHSHTLFSDGKLQPEEHIKSALQHNLTSFGFSDHAPVPFPTSWCMKEKNLAEYINHIEILKNNYSEQIEIYAGLEIDFIAGCTGATHTLFRDLNIDYHIGSIHFVDKLPNGNYWNIDGNHSEFDYGLKVIHGNHIRKAVTSFYEATRQMIKKDQPDIIGHLDKIKMHNIENCYFDEDETWYKELVFAILEDIEQSGCIVEVNTRGLYRNDIKDIFPGTWILKEILKRKIPVVISSDSHHPGEITRHFEDTEKLLYSLGFRETMILRSNTWQQEKIVP